MLANSTDIWESLEAVARKANAAGIEASTHIVGGAAIELSIGDRGATTSCIRTIPWVSVPSANSTPDSPARTVAGEPIARGEAKIVSMHSINLSVPLAERHSRMFPAELSLKAEPNALFQTG
jgi:hypothetical protein